MKTEIKRSIRPQNIMQAYRMANQEAAATQNYDDKIRAFDKVIHFCKHTDSCRLEPSVKRNMLLFWAYDKVGTAYLGNHKTEAAMEYFQRGLEFAGSNKQRKTMLAKIARIHQLNGEDQKWRQTRQMLIELLPDSEQFPAYLNLAAEYPEANAAAGVLETALQAADGQKVTVEEKCRHILKVGQRLKDIYHHLGRQEDLQRIDDLVNRTELLLAKAEGKIN